MNDQITAILFNLAPLILLIFVAYFLMIRPQQKRTAEHKQLMAGLKAGDKVVTVGGIHGTVRSVDHDTVTISVNNKGTELTLDKMAIRGNRV